MSSEKVQTFTDENFDTTVVGVEGPVLVDFGLNGAAPAASWRPP